MKFGSSARNVFLFKNKNDRSTTSTEWHKPWTPQDIFFCIVSVGTFYSGQKWGPIWWALPYPKVLLMDLSVNNLLTIKKFGLIITKEDICSLPQISECGNYLGQGMYLKENWKGFVFIVLFKSDRLYLRAFT